MSVPKELIKVMGLRSGFGADTIPKEYFKYKPVPLNALLESIKKQVARIIKEHKKNNRPSYFALINRIVKRNNLVFIDTELDKDFIKGTGQPEEEFIDRSYCYGGDIVLGTYKNKEARLLSFLHELGHIKINRNNFDWDINTTYDFEKGCWRYAFSYAGKLGIKVSKETINWANKELESYNNEEYNSKYER